MNDAVPVSIAEATRLAARALSRAGASARAADSTAKALVAAERDGQKGHGLSRVASYAGQVRRGKVAGAAEPSLTRLSEAAITVDAGLGFAYPAIDAAIEALIPIARTSHVALAAIRRSHHFGQAGLHVERLAEEGLIALLFGNTPKAMAFWGGAKPMMGTNPIAFAAPCPHAPPLVIDLALSVAARAKIVAAKTARETIPIDWAFDEHRRPTTDAAAALKGSMAPAGGPKGAALALMVEVLGAALTGAHFGFEASSFLDAEGSAPDMGHIIIAIDPGPVSGGAYSSRMADLIAAIASEAVRLPGSTRLKNRQQAAERGLLIAPRLLSEIRTLAGEV